MGSKSITNTAQSLFFQSPRRALSSVWLLERCGPLRGLPPVLVEALALRQARTETVSGCRGRSHSGTHFFFQILVQALGQGDPAPLHGHTPLSPDGQGQACVAHGRPSSGPRLRHRCGVLSLPWARHLRLPLSGEPNWFGKKMTGFWFFPCDQKTSL